MLGSRCTKAQYLALRRRWNAKLSAGGLHDIERVDEDGYAGPHLSHRFSVDAYSLDAIIDAAISGDGRADNSIENYVSVDDAVHEAKREFAEMRDIYFERCALFLSSRHTLAPKGKERRIWRLHAEGRSMRQIAEAVRMPHPGPWKVISRLRKRLAEWWALTADERRKGSGSDE